MLPKLIGVIVLTFFAASNEFTRPFAIPVFIMALAIVFVI